jgi:hypothetical protein
MRRLTLALIATLELAVVTMVGCATVPPPARPAADTPLAVIGIFECDEMKGLIVVSKDGSITPIADDNPDDLKAASTKVGPDSAGAINLSDNCPPRQKT